MDGGGYRCELLTVESTRTPSPNISSDCVSATSALGLPGAIAASSSAGFGAVWHLWIAVFALGVLSKIRRLIIRLLIEVLDTVGVGTPRRSTSSRCAGMQKLRGLESSRLAPLLNQWLALLRHERDVLHSISVSHLASPGLRQASIRYFPIELKGRSRSVTVTVAVQQRLCGIG
jgi:hypothetical protein